MSLVCIVGPQPPPLSGVSSFNRSMLEWAKQLGLSVKCVNTSNGLANRSLFARSTRVIPIFKAVFDIRRALRNEPNGVANCTVSGGYGILGEILVVWMARKHQARIVLHHQGFQYLEKPFAPMRWLAGVAGEDAWHVVLGSNMETSLRALYPSVKKTTVVSSALFSDELSAVPAHRPAAKCRIVGFLSVLIPEKGLFDIVDMARWAQEEKLDFEFRVAGQFPDNKIRIEFEERCRGLQNLRYLGSLSVEEKKKFFSELDVFVFPTRYKNEAGPKVLIEALSQECPIITFDRGCIASMCDSTCGHLVPRDANFMEHAVSTLTLWQNDPAGFAKLRLGARAKFEQLVSENQCAKHKLADILCGKELAQL